MRPSRTDHARQLPTGWAIPTGVVAGAAIGLLVGILLGQHAPGLSVGAAVGLLTGASVSAVTATPADRRAAVLAVAVALLAVGLTITLLIVVR